MDITSIQEKIDRQERPDRTLPLMVQALWYDALGDWDKAHVLAQDESSKNGAWVHAYLHRKEGDIGNASYWYGKAGKPMPEKSLKQEWEELMQYFIT